ncbi:MAG: hypothetical protein APR54_07630, partial [Candidatus Cloacimonas sp. SDB]
MSEITYQEFMEKRDKYTNDILSSDSTKKVILAGPGTGKSHLFKQVCKDNLVKGKDKNLALSFINELVNELRKDLYGLAEVHTLHSFAKSLFPGVNKMSMKLCEIIKDEYSIFTGLDVDFKEILCKMLTADKELSFFSKRRKYYRSVGPDCTIYGLIKYWEVNPNKIPSYSQILVDEYQDFNKLEITFIDMLSQKSPILVVGDDDQSLYDFKYALPDIIRERYSDGSYSSFSLPFCSRCTRVITDAFNSFVNKAKENGFLKTRADKEFLYFPSKDKDKISEENPKIIVNTKIFDSKISYCIENEIKNIYNNYEKDFTVLIICPLKDQILRLSKALRKKGFVDVREPKSENFSYLVEGFKLLLEDKDSNLGWRIVSKELIQESDNSNFKTILENTISDPTLLFKEVVKKIDKDLFKKIRFIRAGLNKIINNNEIKEEDFNQIRDVFKIDKLAMLSIYLKKF